MPKDNNPNNPKRLYKDSKHTIVLSTRTDIRLIAALLDWLERQGQLPDGNMSEALDLLLQGMALLAHLKPMATTGEALTYLASKGYSIKQYKVGDSRRVMKALLDTIDGTEVRLGEQLHHSTLPNDLDDIAAELHRMRAEPS